MSPPPHVEQPRRNLTSSIVPALALAGVASLIALLAVGRFREQPAEASPEGCILAGQGAEQIGGPISLVDVRNQPVTQADFSEGPTIIYFGFTHCPDICPTTMYALADALALPGGYDVQPMMITVDPERDTPEVMAEYVRTDGFPEGLQGLSGSPVQVDAAADAFRVVHEKSTIEGAPADVYNVDHSSFLYVMDASWQTQAILPTQGRTPEEIAACIAAGLDRS